VHYPVTPQGHTLKVLATHPSQEGGKTGLVTGKFANRGQSGRSIADRWRKPPVVGPAP
jgi:hypothetical protein